MNPKNQIRVVIERDNDFGTIAGWRAKDLITRCGGRLRWSRRHKAWVTNERIASDVLAAAEADGCSVSITVMDGGSQ